ncbi:MAG: hypothetical protein V4629_08300 [Pseudomonadota bacterium]
MKVSPREWRDNSTQLLQRISRQLAKRMQIAESELPQKLRIAETLTDWSAIVSLRQQARGNIAPWEDMDYLNWRYQKSPNNKCQFWIFEHQQKIIGGIGVEQCTSHWKGFETLQPNASIVKLLDIVVDPAWAGFGLGPWLNVYWGMQADIALVIGSNPNSRPLLLKTMLRLSDRVMWRRSIVWSVHLRDRWNKTTWSRLQHRLWHSLWAIPIYCERQFNVFRKLYLKQRCALSNTAIEPIFDFNVLEELLQKINTKKHVMSDQRTSETLAWRFQHNPRREYCCIGLCFNNSWLGYLIFNQYLDEKSKKIIQLCDWGSVENAENGFSATQILQLLVAFVLTHTSLEDHVRCECLEYDAAMARALKMNGLIARPHEEHMLTLGIAGAPRFTDPVLNQLLDKKNWMLSDFDADADGF